MRFKDLNEIVQEHARDAMPCVVCGAPTHGRGIFSCGNESEKWGCTTGKLRTIIFPVCRHHDENDPEATAKIEKACWEFTEQGGDTMFSA